MSRMWLGYNPGTMKEHIMIRRFTAASYWMAQHLVTSQTVPSLNQNQSASLSVVCISLSYGPQGSWSVHRYFQIPSIYVCIFFAGNLCFWGCMLKGTKMWWFSLWLQNTEMEPHEFEILDWIISIRGQTFQMVGHVYQGRSCGAQVRKLWLEVSDSSQRFDNGSWNTLFHIAQHWQTRNGHQLLLWW